jgi:hypothetical protein
MKGKDSWAVVSGQTVSAYAHGAAVVMRPSPAGVER